MELNQVPTKGHYAWLAFAVGFWALAGQFVVNRIVFFYIANSEYTAATIIALHLAGFWLGATVARRRTLATDTLILGTLLATAAAEVLTWRLGAVVFGLPVTVAFAVMYGLVLATLSGAIIIGLMRHDKQGQRVIIADTAGSVAGAAAGGFILLPLLGIHASFGLLLLIQGSVWLALRFSRPLLVIERTIAIATCTGLLLLQAALPTALNHAPRAIAVDGMPVEEKYAPDNKLRYSARSPYGLISVIEIGPKLQLNIDGRPLCSTRSTWRSVEDTDISAWVTGSYPVQQAGKLTGARIANIGLGCGMTMAAMLANAAADANLDVIEINPGMPAAQRNFEPALPHTQDDPRVRLILRDGFRYFADYDGPDYDAVSIDLAWMQNMNATHLFSVEMYRNIKAHLKPDGVLGVWIEETNPLSPTALIIYRTLAEVFPHVVADVNHGVVVLYASATRADLSNGLHVDSQRISEYLPEAMPLIPLNRLDNLVMNRTKFNWWGDSRWEMLLKKYSTMRDRFWGRVPE